MEVDKKYLVFRCSKIFTKPKKYFPVTDLAEDDLWRQVLRGPAQGPGSSLHSLGEPEICDLKYL